MATTTTHTTVKQTTRVKVISGLDSNDLTNQTNTFLQALEADSKSYSVNVGDPVLVPSTSTFYLRITYIYMEVIIEQPSGE